MRRFLILLGSLTVALGVALAAGATVVIAAESASYRLDAEYPSQATNDRRTSTNYQMESGVTWAGKILAIVVVVYGCSTGLGGMTCALFMKCTIC